MKEYWFISYLAAGYDRGPGLYANDAIDVSPAEFIRQCYVEKHSDLPYVILYAEKISKELYSWYCENV